MFPSNKYTSNSRSRSSGRVHGRAHFLGAAGHLHPWQRQHIPRAPKAGQPEKAPAKQKGNKLNIQQDDLASVAGAWTGTPSRLAADILSGVADMPMTTSIPEYCERAVAVQQWQAALQKGQLPDLQRTSFPAEPFRSKFAAALSRLEMPRFTRRYHKLADAVLRQMLIVTKDFELELLKQQANQLKQQPKPQAQPKAQQGGEDGENSEAEEQPDGGGGGDQDADGDPDGSSEQQMQDGSSQSLQEQLESGQQGDADSSQNMEIKIESMDGGAAQESGEDGEDLEERLAAAAEDLADEVVKKFEEEMAPVMEHVEAAMRHFGDLDDLLRGTSGWDLSHGMWQQSGWRVFKDLQKRLEKLRELRDLVRSLGRGGGNRPMRRAPEQVWASRNPPGVLRSELVPEEVRSLTKGGDLTQMLPVEAAMLAMGWPRERGKPEEEEEEEVVATRGSHPARLLFMARLAEKGLLSYRREGWVDDEPSRLTGHMEVRPAAELGPIIVCLDTSGSMRGPREVVAKSLVLECMRGAHAQNRKCFVYAFSGPGEVISLELDLSSKAIQKLLEFLQYSFSGGTDADEPLMMSLACLQQQEWEAADILMVTDGELRPPRQDLLDRLAIAHRDLGLRVHGLLVGSEVTPAMQALCTDVHLFKSWSAVKGSRDLF
jgi:uncharacterized protein with von Willebrand factor type A (vWA) domain